MGRPCWRSRSRSRRARHAIPPPPPHPLPGVPGPRSPPLGRAPLAAGALAAMQRIAAGYASLEYDVGRGSRGSRQRHVRDLLIELTGAEDALVVNNAAGALLLALSALARGGEAVVSRAEL